MHEKFIWASEIIAEGLLEYYAVKDVVVMAKTKYQNVAIIDTIPYGRCLVIDGKIQSSRLDEHVYHETLVHPAMVTASDARRVLIIGGGEGATAREVERWKTVEEVEMVEIDREVVELCRLHMPELSAGAFDDKRLKLVISEGRQYLASKENGSLDVIIVDATDPTEDASSIPLYAEEFYRIAFSKLREGGVIVTQATSIVHNPYVFRSIFETVSSVFPKTTPLAAFVTSYASLWGFVVGSKKRSCRDLTTSEVEAMLSEMVRGRLRFYSGETHRLIVNLANLYLKNYESGYRIIRDGSPVTVP